MRLLQWASVACALVPASVTAFDDGVAERYPWNYAGSRARAPRPPAVVGSCGSTVPTVRTLIAGDSWAQFLWDDDTHNRIFDRFGHADKLALSRSLGENPGPGHVGPEYAVSGSEAREWVDTGSYPWIANVVNELNGAPAVDTVMLSVGGNDILAGRPDGGWYKDMDLDVTGSEAALFARILDDSDAIATAVRAVRPGIEVLVSSYEYPNFNVSPLWCWLYACPKREELSRDPDNDLVTDEELNAMILDVEAERIAWTNAEASLRFDHAVGEMHHYYGDGVAAPGALPRPGQVAPGYLPFPGGNPLTPTLRENFRTVLGVDADPIHLDEEGYLYKAAVQAESYFFPKFRGAVTITLHSEGGVFDGWTNGAISGTDGIRFGDDGVRSERGIVSFDTSSIPPGATLVSGSLILLLDGADGDNPLLSGALGAPTLDVRSGSFGAPQVEISDFDAAADASDVGCFVGSALAEFDALRIDLGPAGLQAIQGDGRTQFRIAFPGVDPGIDRLNFKDGDATLPLNPAIETVLEYVDVTRPDGTADRRLVLGSSLPHRGVAEVLGSATPFLDLVYEGPIFSDGFESGDTSAWAATVP